MQKRRFTVFAAIAIVIVMLMIGIVFIISNNSGSGILLKEYSIHAEEMIEDGKAVNVRRVLEDICNENNFKKRYVDLAERESIECDDINIYPDRYYLKYVATDEFRAELLEVNTDGVSGNMFSDYVDIYLPVFARIDGDERIIASIRIYFDSRDKTYHAIERAPYFEANVENLFEKFERFINTNQVTDCIWVYDSNEGGYTHSSIMLVKIDGIYKVYDYENIFDEKDFSPILYDVEDYVALKNAYESKNISNPPYAGILIAVAILFITVTGIVLIFKKIIRKK